MLPVQLKADINKHWESLWPVSNIKPLIIVDLIAYLLFLQRLEELQALKENEAQRSGQPVDNPVFTEEEQELRWRSFREMDADHLHHLFTKDKGVFNFINNYCKGRNLYSRYLKAPLMITPTAKILKSAVEIIKCIEANKDYGSAAYEYIVNKFSETAENGQLPTPPHIIRLMVEMIQPTPDDIIADPAAGAGTFLLAALAYLKVRYASVFANNNQRRSFYDRFRGWEADPVILRIGAMNMILHGIEDPKFKEADISSLVNNASAEQATIVITNPPFAFSATKNEFEKELLQNEDASKPALLYLALILKGLKPGGRAAVIVPESLLLDKDAPYQDIRREIVDQHKLEAVISMPGGLFRPHTGIGTDMLLFTKTATGGTDKVWFYDMKNDGFSLDNKRTPLVEQDDNGELSFPNDYGDIPDMLKRWRNRAKEMGRVRTDKSFFVGADDIRQNGYNLKMSSYKETSSVPNQVSKPEKIIVPKIKPEEVVQKTKIPEIPNTIKQKTIPPPFKKEQKKEFTAGSLLPLLLILCLGAGAAYFLFFKNHNDTPDILANKQITTSPNQPQPTDQNNFSKNNQLKSIRREDTVSRKIKDEAAPLQTNSTDTQVPASRNDLQKTGNTLAKADISDKEKPFHSSPDYPAEKEVKMKYRIARKAYFYDEPQARTRQKQEVIRKNDPADINVLDEKNGFIYTVVTNRQGQTYRGWLRKKDLKQIKETVDEDDIK